MDLRSARYFVAVAEELHFGRAAKRMHISQPGLSQGIRSLERVLGIPLFERSRQRVSLTAMGEALLPGVRRLLASADEVEAVASGLAEQFHGTLSLGYTRSGGLGVSSELTSAFRRAHPQIRLVTSQGTSGGNIDALLRRRLDCAFVRPPVSAAGALGFLTVGREEVLVGLPVGHRLSAVPNLSCADLVREPLVFFPRSAGGLWDAIVDAVYGPRATPPVCREEPDVPHMLVAVAEGVGITLVTEESAAVLDVPGVVLRRLRDAPTVRLDLAWHRDNTNVAVRTFVAYAHGAVAPRAAERAGAVRGVPPGPRSLLVRPRTRSAPVRSAAS